MNETGISDKPRQLDHSQQSQQSQRFRRKRGRQEYDDETTRSDIKALQESHDIVYEQFLNDLRDKSNQVFAIQIGLRASGKSTKALAVCRWAMDQKLFDVFYMFLPAASKDIHHSYAWLNQEKYRNRVFIFTEWSEDFARCLLERSAQEVEKCRSMIFMDDLSATGFDASGAWFFRLIGQLRHDGVQ